MQPLHVSEQCSDSSGGSFCRFCPLCKVDDSAIVKAGEKLKESKKKAKMASATTKSNRDWGKVGETHHPACGFVCSSGDKQTALFVLKLRLVQHSRCGTNSEK